MLAELKHERFEESLLNPLRGKALTTEESFVASMLLEATAKRTIGIKRLRDALNEAAGSRHWTGGRTKYAERDVKNIIRTLRKKHELPILSRRKDGGGFWWCENEAQMQEYYTHARRQPMDELHTLSRIVKANYPALAGQLSMDYSWCGNVDGEVAADGETGRRGDTEK
jgi:hypothetical protein